MKRIVLCCDGTWNSAEQKNPTNVQKIRNLIQVRSNSGIAQRVYYQQGVGSGSVFERLPGLFGKGLWSNVQRTYRYLVENYEAGDEIYLFGFSRGAYTARSIGGLIRKSGVLRADRVDEIREAYDLYRNGKVRPSDQLAVDFRRDNSVYIGGEDPHVPNVKFIGVWDTVGALGVPLGTLTRFTQRRHMFHDVALSRIVENAYHALAIDERRGDYQPTLWEQHPDAKTQRLEQRWFAGVHTNVGGGAPDAVQSDRALLWMIRKAASCDLAFDSEKVAAIADRVDGSIHDSFVHIFKLRPFYRRPIGEGVPAHEATYLGGISNETVDPAVLARNLKDPSYMPPNLVAYYREHPEQLELAKKAL
jgi:uncharacterized protein (DUF2235 family)